MTEFAFKQLQSELSARVPYAALSTDSLPQVPELVLSLLAADYPQHKLTGTQAQALMDEPPYWAFCWASGQVLARYLLDRPELAKNKLIVDFGCGSGVAGIAAALAGAEHVLMVDSDPIALAAARYNAKLNGVSVECYPSLDAFDQNTAAATVLISDVFYDRDNLLLLDRFLADFGQVIVADSRITKNLLHGVAEVATYQSHTVPDLAESAQFNLVRVYQSA
ncbi:class I SAM-dependent methyltransferase [Arenicella xantha]|uniref:Putative nicotinamide N-methyase n=1 Tax=Arenicella xantha TaxID=644221 RepID=A0A395JMZ4_9GAMM|nr:50S ribosomal protein L11 methyltransferase [Arenicella xantha]RBP52847.1 putative nicotinamide N-methyase [Arenicella xantha]